MKLTALFESAKGALYLLCGGDSCRDFARRNQIEEAKANLADALKLALQCQRELAEKGLSPHPCVKVFEITEA